VDAWHVEQDPLVADLAPTREQPLPLPCAAIRAGLRLLLPDRAPRIVLEMPAGRLHWRTTLGADAVLTSDIDDGFVVRGATGRRLLARTLRQHARLALRWRRLNAPTARTLHNVSSPAAWERTIGVTSEEA
ncbi:MAG: hypothetical protein L0H74_11765, partial [Brachybacterium sp.]|nr:hypothetical protein [Brachybacterium sp.]